MPQQDSYQTLASVSIFAGVQPSALAELARASRERTYPKGQVLCSEGDPGESLILLEAGQVRISRYTDVGQEVVLAVADAPAVFGELALIDGAPRSATIIATNPVTVRLIERTAFLALVEREPTVAMALLRALAGMIRATNERLADVLALDVPGRVAKWLLARTPRQPPYRGDRIPFPISQGDLAAELGTTRVSVNKALRTFEAIGAIRVESNQIVLIAPDVLAEHARSFRV
jgi:CRP/FNR family transcriptional regulator